MPLLKTTAFCCPICKVQVKSSSNSGHYVISMDAPKLHMLRLQKNEFALQALFCSAQAGAMLELGATAKELFEPSQNDGWLESGTALWWYTHVSFTDQRNAVASLFFTSFSCCFSTVNLVWCHTLLSVSASDQCLFFCKRSWLSCNFCVFQCAMYLSDEWIATPVSQLNRCFIF